MIGTKLAQRYEITGELGRGGMGRVYLAQDPHLQREVAIKVLDLVNIGSQAEQRFLREAQLVAKMDHPSIVPIYDLGRHEESLFFVMPVVNGETLHALIRQGALALGEILEIAAQVAEALDYSHQQGVVHRDVKPENVMVTRGESLRARVMDFGLALGDSVNRLTRTGSLPGTLAYLSPEQILAVDVDGRTDLYSLGTILYECLAGKPPFAGSRYALLYQIVNEPPAPLESFGIGEGLASIVAKCLDKEPGRRPGRGNDLAMMLHELAEELSQSVRDRDVVHAGSERGESAGPSLIPLVGRRQEVEALVARLEAAAERECQLVLIGAEAGLGKTRLVEELEQIGRRRGFRVLRGRFSDQESAFPFQGFGELIRDSFRGQESSSSSGVPDLSDLGADLQALFPMLSELPPLRDAARQAGFQGLGLEAARRGDPTHLFEVLARTLRRLEAGKPAIFLLEHLQGAEISIEALQYLVRRLGPTPSLFVGTYRPSEVGRRHPLTTLVKSFKDEPRFLHLVLKPLGEGESQELVRSLVGGGEVSHELVKKLYDAAEGNPYFTQELIHSLMDQGEMSRDEAGVWVLSGEAALAADSLPETIQQVVEARIEVLPDEISRVLQVASVLGRSFDYEELEDLVGDEVEDAVERLLHEGLLAEDRRARRDRLHFASGVVRDVLHSGLSRRRRRALHRRHASLLEERFAGRPEQVCPQLVHHFAAGDEPEKTVRYALLLARRSTDAVGSEAAVRALRTALEFAVDEEVAIAPEGELRLLLAEALRSGGAHEVAMKEAGRAVRALERGRDLAGAAKAALVAAETAWQGRRVGETRRWVEKGIELARLALSKDTLHRLLILGSTIANLRGEHQKARARWEEAQELVAAAPEEPLPRGGVLVTTLPLEVHSLDVRDVLTLEDKEVLANVFETLVYSDDGGHLGPLLCEEWEKSADSRIFRFQLRREARFSDGGRLVAADVKRSMEEAARRSPSPACSMVVGCEELREGETEELRGIEVLGEHTVRFHLREPLPIFPVLLTDVKTAVFRLDEAGEPIGTGPFKLSEHRRDPIRLVRNESYWRGASPNLDAIEFRLGIKSAAAAEALFSGDLDLGRDFAPDALDGLLRDERFRSGLVEATRQGVYLVAFHRQGPGSSRPEVRRALAEVIRPEEIVLRTLGRFAQPANCLIPPAVLGHDPNLVRPQRSPEEARAFLEEAGLEPPVKLRAVIQPLLRDRFRPFLDMLLAQWSAAGLEVEFDTPTLGTYLDRARDAEGMDLWIGRWGADYDDPDSFTYALLSSGCGYLADYLASPAIDEIVEQARRESRSANRRVLYRELESLLAENNVLLPLFYDVDYRLAGPRLRGLALKSAPPYVTYAEVAKLPEAVAKPLAVERDRGAIHVPLATTFTTLSPRMAHLTAASEAISNVFETLTRVDEGARIVPLLATEFRLEDGGRRFRFKLRNNVRFHDGRKLSVRDVRHTFEELARHRDEVAEAQFLPLRGARAFREGEASELKGFVIVSANEFVIDLDHALSFFPAMLTSSTMAVVPEGLRRFSGNWSEGCCGTGPFRVALFVPGKRLELDANPYYWRRQIPRCERLVFELGRRPEEVFADLSSGRRVVASGLVPALVAELRRDAELVPGYHEAPGLSTWFLAAVPGGVLADPELRSLLAPFLDVDAVVRSTLGRLAQPAHGLIPPGLLGYEPREHRATPAGESGRGLGERPLAGVELRVSLVPPYLGELAPLWNGLRHNLESAGAKVRAVAASAGKIIESMAREEVDLVGGRWMASYPDPDCLIHYFHSRGVLAPLTASAELDELFERGRLETDAALRHTIYLQIDQSLTGSGAVIPLFHDQIYRLVHRQITGGRLRFGWPELAYEELELAS